jgi:hypothetical protein
VLPTFQPRVGRRAGDRSSFGPGVAAPLSTRSWTGWASACEGDRQRYRSALNLDRAEPHRRDAADAGCSGGRLHRRRAEAAEAGGRHGVVGAEAYVSRLLSKLELNNRVQVALLVHDAALD